MVVSDFHSLFGAVWSVALLWKRVGVTHDASLSGWAGACHISILYGFVCMDCHLCAPWGNAIYKAQTLFLLRQFASKIKTMRFTMGNTDSAVCTGVSRLLCRDDVQFL